MSKCVKFNDHLISEVRELGLKFSKFCQMSVRKVLFSEQKKRGIICKK